MLTKKDAKKLAARIASYAIERYRNVMRRPPRSVLEQLVHSLISRESGPAAADRAVRLLLKPFVDWNEIRVSSVRQIASAIADKPLAREVAARLRETLEPGEWTEFEARYSKWTRRWGWPDPDTPGRRKR